MNSGDNILDYMVENTASGHQRYINADDVVLVGTSIIFYNKSTIVKIVPQENHTVTCISEEFKFKQTQQ